jgi:murein L,D-transpeptidase YafK
MDNMGKASTYRPQKVANTLRSQLEHKQLQLGSAIFIRIFKQSSELEVWVQNSQGLYTLFKNYPICAYSGQIGPKLKEGDMQAPEGFYTVAKHQMNPNSSYHLSFNIGYPNKYDSSHNRTGSYLMVHGDCVSIGCYAMTDKKIEEIYTLANATLNNGQKKFSVHAFPFRMIDANMLFINNLTGIHSGRILSRGMMHLN